MRINEFLPQESWTKKVPPALPVAQFLFLSCTSIKDACLKESKTDRCWCGQDFLLFFPIRQAVLKLWNKAVQRGKGSHLISRDVVILHLHMHLVFLSLLELQHPSHVCKAVSIAIGHSTHIASGACLMAPQCATSTSCQSTRVALWGIPFSKLYWDVYFSLGFSSITISSFKHGIHNSQVKSIYYLP